MLLPINYPSKTITWRKECTNVFMLPQGWVGLHWISHTSVYTISIAALRWHTYQKCYYDKKWLRRLCILNSSVWDSLWLSPITEPSCLFADISCIFVLFHRYHIVHVMTWHGIWVVCTLNPCCTPSHNHICAIHYVITHALHMYCLCTLHRPLHFEGECDIVAWCCKVVVGIYLSWLAVAGLQLCVFT